MTPTPELSYEQAAHLVDTLRQQRQAHLLETHISWVLLDGQEAWKFKKPVRLPFLDASHLATRRHLCEEETRLNRRLAASLYLGVAPVAGTPDAPHLFGSGPVIEYAVHMRQFPEGALLSERLAAGQLAPEHLDRFALRLARFHREAQVAPPDSPYGTPDIIELDTRHVLTNLAACGDTDASARMAGWLDAQLPSLRPQWAQRLAQGRVVEGHGDLHLANVVVLDDEVTAFDCIEFDPSLRWVDALSDVAFLMMDLMAHQRPDLAYRFLNAYLDESGDHEGLPVLRQYLVYRALVRALVARLRAGPGQPLSGPDYLGLAAQLIAPSDARLMITHGVSGSGKTYVSQQLLEQAQAVRLRSDVERKRLFGAERPDLYDARRTQATYDRLHALASIALEAGWRVIVDATFLDHTERARFEALAAQRQRSFTILHCQAPTQTLHERISQRLRQAHDASDADHQVLAQQLTRDAGLAPEEQPHTLTVDASTPWSASTLARQWLAAPCQTSMSTSSPCNSISSRREAASPLPISLLNDTSVRSKPGSP